MKTEEVQDSIVRITSSQAENEEFGTGFVFHLDEVGAYILTCAHVIEDVGGPDKVRVSGIAAKVIANGERNGLDLAVLHVPGFTNKRPLILRSNGELGHAIAVLGCYEYGKYRAIGRLTGALSKQFALEILNQKRRAKAWGFEIKSPDTLEAGYSGSPVLHENDPVVLGVVITRQGEQEGAAISIDALPELWTEMPSELLQIKSEESPLTSGTSKRRNVPEASSM